VQGDECVDKNGANLSETRIAKAARFC